MGWRTWLAISCQWATSPGVSWSTLSQGWASSSLWRRSGACCLPSEPSSPLPWGSSAARSSFSLHFEDLKTNLWAQSFAPPVAHSCARVRGFCATPPLDCATPPTHVVGCRWGRDRGDHPQCRGRDSVNDHDDAIASLVAVDVMGCDVAGSLEVADRQADRVGDNSRSSRRSCRPRGSNRAFGPRPTRSGPRGCAGLAWIATGRTSEGRAAEAWRGRGRAWPGRGRSSVFSSAYARRWSLGWSPSGRLVCDVVRSVTLPERSRPVEVEGSGRVAHDLVTPGLEVIRFTSKDRCSLESGPAGYSVAF